MSLRGRALIPIRAAAVGSEGCPSPRYSMSPRRNCAEATPATAASSSRSRAMREIARPHMPVQIDRADDAVRFTDAVSRGFVQPSQRLGRDRAGLRSQKGTAPARSSAPVPRRAPPPRCAISRLLRRALHSAERARGGTAPSAWPPLRGLPVPLHRLGEIALDPLAFDIELRDPKRRLARTRRTGGPPAPQRGSEAPSRIGRIATVHVTRSARTSDHRSWRKIRGEDGAAHGSRIASPTP